MIAFVRPALAILACALLAACGQPIATPAPTAAVAPAAAPTRRPAAAAPAPTTAAALGAGSAQLAAATLARWDWRTEVVVELPAGTAYTATGDQAGGWCRIAIARGAQPWVRCDVIGVAVGRGPGPEAPAAPPAPADAALVAPVVDAAPVDAAPPLPAALPAEDALAQQQARRGAAPRDLPADVANAPACGGSPLCQGMTNGDVEAAARAAEAAGDYTEAARLRQYLPGDN